MIGLDRRFRVHRYFSRSSGSNASALWPSVRDRRHLGWVRSFARVVPSWFASDPNKGTAHPSEMLRSVTPAMVSPIYPAAPRMAGDSRPRVVR